MATFDGLKISRKVKEFCDMAGPAIRLSSWHAKVPIKV